MFYLLTPALMGDQFMTRLLKLQRSMQQAHSGCHTPNETKPHKDEQHLGRSFLINYKSDHRLLDPFSAVHDVCRYDIGNWQEGRQASPDPKTSPIMVTHPAGGVKKAPNQK